MNLSNVASEYVMLLFSIMSLISDFRSFLIVDVRKGRYTYSPEYNKITLLKFYKKSDLHETDFVKYAEPTNHEMVVYSADGENMDIYEGTDMCYWERVNN